MDVETRRLLVDGARLVLNGKQVEARELLMQYLDKDELSEEGWLWMSGAVDSPEDIETALDNCLTINPDNLRAIQGKQWLHEYRKRLMLEKQVSGARTRIRLGDE
ncbi:MAG: hypothetical protein HXX08_11635 [Chloroflexi bacterium]|uniref:Uncharacterized protein n=1 Tax=Candidatus Chlorohelix allophototropha TaxID=3003348 RepID=A0A8T7M2V0_9CHLR|nr:hypothetical protein [Chloroflexota bacterium]WJW65890.1 hypothetical protein OZ401_001670 [Chloroflexota bacterium L227-S17]